MMKSIPINISGKSMTGIEVPLPGAPLVVVYGDTGFVMCGYLDIQTANRLGLAAAIVRGVNSVDDLLKAPIHTVSEKAAQLGIKPGDIGRDALARLV